MVIREFEKIFEVLWRKVADSLMISVCQRGLVSLLYRKLENILLVSRHC